MEFGKSGLCDKMDFETELLRLQSWKRILVVVEEYFTEKSSTPEEISHYYYASSKLFQLFFQEYNEIIERMADMNRRSDCFQNR